MLNLTQHPATPEQVAAGVIDVNSQDRAALSAWLTFDTLPTQAEVFERAQVLAGIVAGDSKSVRCDPHTQALIGGAPFLMAPLEAALSARGITAFYAFSVRESIEQTQQDGSVRKIATFKHAGFVAGAQPN